MCHVLCSKFDQIYVLLVSRKYGETDSGADRLTSVFHYFMVLQNSIDNRPQ